MAMGLFKKRIDPITDRSRALQAEIAALEDEIRQLNARIQDGHDAPRVRSTALPSNQGSSPAPNVKAGPREPIFERIDRNKMPGSAGASAPPNPSLDLGVRNTARNTLWSRLKDHFRAPPAANPKLVSYLAAGSIKGLRPLRYEKRVARNRFLWLTGLLLLLLWGIYAAFVRIY